MIRRRPGRSASPGPGRWTSASGRRDHRDGIRREAASPSRSTTGGANSIEPARPDDFRRGREREGWRGTDSQHPQPAEGLEAQHARGGLSTPFVPQADAPPDADNTPTIATRAARRRTGQWRRGRFMGPRIIRGSERRARSVCILAKALDKTTSGIRHRATGSSAPSDPGSLTGTMALASLRPGAGRAAQIRAIPHMSRAIGAIQQSPLESADPRHSGAPGWPFSQTHARRKAACPQL